MLAPDPAVSCFASSLYESGNTVEAIEVYVLSMALQHMCSPCRRVHLEEDSPLCVNERRCCAQLGRHADKELEENKDIVFEEVEDKEKRGLRT